MGRTKAFDPQQVLNQALMIFWQQGYEGTSIADLEKNLKINKFSLYNTFGNKHQLYLQALDLYVEQRFKPLLGILKFQSQQGIATLLQFFEALRLGLSAQPEVIGCFVVCAGAERSATDPEVRQRVQWVYGQLEDGFYACLESAQQQQQISANISLQNLARFLVVQSQGMLTVGRNQQDLRTVGGSYEFTKTMLQTLVNPATPV
ncbi:MAG: TetR/AcrR family transcriptional regulator [Pseudomonadales bacterium]|nr:TetR/AcrR family transcriptional regulator [Pseudomonadales bacterium]